MADKFDISESRKAVAENEDYYGGGAPEAMFRWLAEKIIVKACQKSDDGTKIGKKYIMKGVVSWRFLYYY